MASKCLLRILELLINGNYDYPGLHGFSVFEQHKELIQLEDSFRCVNDQ